MIGSDAWLAELKALTARYVEDRVAMGACSSMFCKRPAEDGKVTCETCSGGSSRSAARIRARRKAEHQCLDCGKQLRGSPYQCCKECRRVKSIAGRNRRAMYKRLGMCIRCGAALPEQSAFAQCKPCRDKRSQYLRERKARANAALEESQGN